MYKEAAYNTLGEGAKNTYASEDVAHWKQENSRDMTKQKEKSEFQLFRQIERKES